MAVGEADEFEVDLEFLLVTSEVQVVQSVDAKALKATLKYILDQLQKREKPKAPKTPAEILSDAGDRDALRKAVEQLVIDNAAMAKDMEALKSKLEAQDEILVRRKKG